MSALPGLCAAAAAAARRVVFSEIARRRGEARAVRARQLAVYLQHVAFGDKIAACARLYRRDRATVRHACARIEDARDDPRFDLAAKALEAALRAQHKMICRLLEEFTRKRSNVMPKEEDLARAARRLLKVLSEPGAAAAPSELEADALVLLSVKNGVTIAKGSLPAAAAERALAEGLAAWTKDGGARRLRLTEAGRAHVRRSEAPAEPFRAQHSRIAHVAEKDSPPALVNERESPLAWLARRKDRAGRPFLEPAQIEAGERFRRDVERAHLLQRVTANWEAPTHSGSRGAGAGAQVSELAMDARRRFSRACDAVGPDLSGLLIDVCGYLKRLEIVESERGWPARSGKIVLRIALQRLAGHYGLASEARGPARAGAPLHWGAEDFRPSLF